MLEKHCPNEMLKIILEGFGQKELVMIISVSKHFCTSIRNIEWNDLMVHIYGIKSIKYVTRKFHFVKLNLSKYSTIDDEKMKYLKKYRKLNLEACMSITDGGLTYLNNHAFQGCRSITNEGLKHLKNCKMLNLSRCILITDNGLKHLKNCNELNLTACMSITNYGLKYLKNCDKLNLALCHTQYNKFRFTAP